MATYSETDWVEVEYDLNEADTDRLKNCGTCACAVGHGPFAGIAALDNEDWQDYETRVFGLSQSDCNFDAWDYTFGPDNDDDAKAAAARIRDVLETQS